MAQLFGRAIDPIQYRPMAHLYERIAPTEFDPWRGRVLCGEVHDENAAAIGGVAGHAGLFGTADAVGAFARIVLKTFEQTDAARHAGADADVRDANRRVPGSSRALAWDTALPTSSSGRRMSPTAIGHTGFTGTSLWIDLGKRFVRGAADEPRAPDARRTRSSLPLRAEFHDALAALVASAAAAARTVVVAADRRRVRRRRLDRAALVRRARVPRHLQPGARLVPSTPPCRPRLSLLRVGARRAAHPAAQ